jgi:hypothetical protein
MHSNGQQVQPALLGPSLQLPVVRFQRCDMGNKGTGVTHRGRPLLIPRRRAVLHYGIFLREGFRMPIRRRHSNRAPLPARLDLFWLRLLTGHCGNPDSSEVLATGLSRQPCGSCYDPASVSNLARR